MARIEVALSRFAPRDLLQILFKRQTAILAFYGGVLLAAILFCFLWPPTYEARVRFLVKHNREEPVISSDQASVRTISRRAVTESDLNDETEIMRSAIVLEKTARDVDLEHLPQHWLVRLLNLPLEAVTRTYNWYHGKANPDAFALGVLRLQKRLFVVPAKKSAILEVRFRWGDRAMAERILRSLQENYFAQRLEVTKAPDTRGFFVAQAEAKRLDLARIEQEMDTIQPGATLDSVRLKQELMGRQAADFQSQWRKARASRDEADAAQRAYRDELASVPSRVVYEQKPLFSDQALGSLKARVLELRLRQTQLLQKYQPTSRNVVQNAQELAQAESILASELATLPSQQTTNVNSVAQSLDERMLLERSRVASHEALATATRRELGHVETQLDQLNRQSVLIRALDRDGRATEQAYFEFLKRAEDARVDDELNRQLTFNVIAIEPVRAGYSPVRPNSMLIFKLALSLGLLLAIGFAFLLEQWDHRVWTQRDIEDYFGVPVITTFDLSTEVPAGGRRTRAASGLQPWDVATSVRDQFRKVRATVCPARSSTICLALCSQDAEEGVSWVASKLACAVAEDSRNVVLVDANTAHLSQKDLLGVVAGPPVLEEAPAPFSVYSTSSRYLSLAALDRSGAGAAQSVHASLVLAVERSRASADVVLVDCEPFARSAQVLHVRGVVDGVLLVVESERTRREVIGRMLESLQRAQVPIAGVLVNKRRRYIPSFIYRLL